MITVIVILHIIIFQAMFFRKNRLLSKKLGKSIRGKNKEAVLSIILFSVTITISAASLLSESIHDFFIPVNIFSNIFFQFTGILLLIISLIISFLALKQMQDSWRVGIKEEDKTELVTDGIFRVSRNPYFLSYMLMFISYILLVTNIFVIILSVISILSIHRMIKKEEAFLESLHGEKYLNYKKEVPRYLFV